MNRPDDGKSAGKPDALQTLRANRCANVFAKRLECGELAPAFAAGGPVVGHWERLGGGSALLNNPSRWSLCHNSEMRPPHPVPPEVVGWVAVSRRLLPLNARCSYNKNPNGGLLPGL